MSHRGGGRYNYSSGSGGRHNRGYQQGDAYQEEYNNNYSNDSGYDNRGYQQSQRRQSHLEGYRDAPQQSDSQYTGKSYGGRQSTYGRGGRGGRTSYAPQQQAVALTRDTPRQPASRLDETSHFVGFSAFNKPKAHTGVIRCMTFIPVTNKLFTGGDDGFLRMWDPDTMDLIYEEHLGSCIDSLLSMTSACASSAEAGALLAVGIHHTVGKGSTESIEDEGIINVLDLVNGRKALLPGHRGAVTSLATDNGSLSNGSRLCLFSADLAGGIKCWDQEAPKPNTPEAAYAASGNLFASPIELKSVVPGAHKGSPITSMAFVGVLITADRHGTIQSWDVSKPGVVTNLQKIEQAHSLQIISLLYYENKLLSASLDGGIKVWSPTNNQKSPLDLGALEFLYQDDG
eukprot:CAMPEP_0175059572 /NCGR_PEP_ID=MMETSP0052_2-20121109/12506_1 /TAXON_ID=51329 ORGANISM="Polytomella parva, Strain SAG 63-3" /NCGR_SAMPLE_ID=MMETSP0052_2 /ASSEMBLY_ACC=CAM_ASM_000194 /LENGTH=399 /DNA_ID=CAMNT_0016325135 /DNA_START=70 /DNA_END=1265 /DNA_ORIENTATION=+